MGQHVSSADYSSIGIMGFVSLFILFLVVLWKWVSFVLEIRAYYALNSDGTSETNISDKIMGKIRKRNLFYFLLLMATASDIPMYVGFLRFHKYNITMYSFHKLQAAFLFGSYSLTISDWTTVLFEIKEDTLMPFLLRKASLLFLNLLFFIISIINFVYCYTTANLQAFLDSTIYEVDLMFMILTPLILTVIMLRSGVKLSVRIQGAAGVAAVDERNHSIFGRVYRSALKVNV